ncbi:MAG: acyltransferase [Bacilli bacterium]|nr:acyltransferase [Bacilli bacterium]
MVTYITCLILGLLGIHFFGRKKFNDAYISKSQSNSIRGLLGIMVVFHHLSQNIDLTLFGYPFFKISGFLIVSVFFFYSGYGLFYSLSKKENYLEKFIVGRIPSIYIPFMSANIIYLVVHILLFKHHYSFSSIIKGFFGFELVSGVFWYMWILLLLYFIFYIIFSSFSKKKGIYIMTFITLLILLTMTTSKGIESYWYISIPGFLTGMWFAFKEKQIISIFKKYYGIALPLVVLFTAYCVMSILGIRFAIYNFYIWCLVYFGLAISINILLILALLKCQIKNKFLDFLGNISLEIYLLHILLLDSIRILGVGQDRPFLFTFLVLESAIVFAYFVHKGNQKIVHWIKAKQSK